MSFVVETTEHDTSLDGSFQNTPAWGTGKYGESCIDFVSGSSQYVDCGYASCLDTPNGLTVCFWFKTSEDSQGVLGKEDDWGFNIEPDHHLNFNVKDDTGTNEQPEVNNVNVDDGNWHFGVGVSDANNDEMYCYVDDTKSGVLSRSKTWTNQTSSSHVKLGYGHSLYYTGSLDRVMVFNRVLSEAELNKIYKKGVVITNGLVGFWRMDENTGTTVRDTHNEITDYLSWATYHDDIKAIDKLELEVSKGIEDKWIPSNGNKVYALKNNQLLFKGYVERVEKSSKYKINCNSDAAVFHRRKCNNAYINTSIDGIVSDLVSTYSSFGTSNIQSTGVTLPEFKSSNTVLDVLNDFGEVMDWHWYVTTDDEFYFEDDGTTSSGLNLTVGTNCFKIGKWIHDSNRMANHITVEGGRREVSTVNTFNGDGTTTDFDLDFTPLGATKVIVDSTEQTLGIEGAVGDFDYEVNKASKRIEFVDSSVPAVGTDNVEVYYEYTIPVRVERKDGNSISSYGEYEYTYKDRSIEEMDEARECASNYLARFKDPLVTGTLETNLVDLNLKAGYTVQVIDSIAGINDTYTIRDVRVYYGKGKQLKSRVVVGSSEVKISDWNKNLDRRIKEVEKAITEDSESLTSNVYPENQEAEHVLLSAGTRSILTTFVLGHSESSNNLEDGLGTGGQLGWNGVTEYTNKYVSGDW